MAAAITAHGAPGTNNNFTVPFNGQFRDITNSKSPSFKSTKGRDIKSIHPPPLTHYKILLHIAEEPNMGKTQPIR
jgi:hypothetical protein